MSSNIQWANFWVHLVSAVITLLAVFVALFRKEFWDWWNKPLVKIGFGNEEPYVLTFYSNDGTITRLFRLKAINLGKTVAKNCRIKIISVVVENQNAKDCLIDEPDVLKWSSAPRDMRFRIDPQNIQGQDIHQLIPTYKESKDITPGKGWEFCDLFRIDSREKKVIFVSSGSRDFLSEDKMHYTAIVEISGDNLKPTNKEIKFSTHHKIDKNLAIHLAKIEEIKDILKK